MATETTTAQASARAGRREWSGLAVLALPTLLLSLDMSVLYLALPQLSADLGVSATQQLWIMDIYGFLIAGFLITMGTVGDRIGALAVLAVAVLRHVQPYAEARREHAGTEPEALAAEPVKALVRAAD